MCRMFFFIKNLLRQCGRSYEPQKNAEIAKNGAVPSQIVLAFYAFLRGE
jgi:hypothetical protein